MPLIHRIDGVSAKPLPGSRALTQQQREEEAKLVTEEERLGQQYLEQQPYPVAPVSSQAPPVMTDEEIDSEEGEGSGEEELTNEVVYGKPEDDEFLFGGINDPFISGTESTKELIEGRPEDDEFLFGTGLDGDDKRVRYDVHPKVQRRKRSADVGVGRTT